MGKSGGDPVNTMILKNYNDGRHGGWNNYCCYNKKNTGHYVARHAKDDKKAYQHREGMAKAGEMIMRQVSGHIEKKMTTSTKS
jgi:hypothetical protein